VQLAAHFTVVVSHAYQVAHLEGHRVVHLAAHLAAHLVAHRGQAVAVQAHLAARLVDLREVVHPLVVALHLQEAALHPQQLVLGEQDELVRRGWRQWELSGSLL
jgi:hypothetical protein